MLMTSARLDATQEQGHTIVDYLISAVLDRSSRHWREFVAGGVSDVDDARSVDLLAGGGHLTLFEREVSKDGLDAQLRATIRTLLGEARLVYDFVLIDSAPGLSVLTECWLREADYYMSPTKPDYISIRGLQFLGQYRQRDLDMGFAELLGVLINMKDPYATADEQFDRWLRQQPKHRCFGASIARATALQTAAHCWPNPRSYWAKYPGQMGRDLRSLAAEVIHRTEQRELRRA
jgi:chromosome partitioning protein